MVHGATAYGPTRPGRRGRVSANIRASLPKWLVKLAKHRYHRGVSSYSIGEAKTQLSRLVHMAEEGEDVVLRRGRQPVARLVAIPSEEGGIRRRPGRMRGRITVPEDFDEWPQDIARELGVLD